MLSDENHSLVGLSEKHSSSRNKDLLLVRSCIMLSLIQGGEEELDARRLISLLTFPICTAGKDAVGNYSTL